MADSKITALTSIGTITDPAVDPLVIVDVSDTSMAATGTTKKVTLNNLLASSPTATLASATITGAANFNGGALAGYLNGSLLFGSSGNTVNFFGQSSGFAFKESTGVNNLLTINTSGFVFGDGAGGTRMTLNSTGLGVGASPLGKFDVYNTGADTTMFIRSDTTRLGQIVFRDNGDSANQGRVKYDHSTDTLSLYSGGNENVFLSSSGNVGIGVTPSAWGGSYKALQLLNVARSIAATGAGSGDLTVAFNAIYDSTDSRWEYATTGDKAGRYSQTGSGNHRWFVSNTTGTAGNEITDFASPAMTLDASGNLLVGATNSVIWNTTNQGCVVGGNAIQASRSGDIALLLNRIGSDGKTAVFARQGLEVGNISVTTTGTTYNSTSDYRLKESVQPLTGGLTRVSALKPSIYKWKADGSNGEGFIAHELAEVVPAAVSGEKDAVNEDGSIRPQGIDMSRVVPVLVAAIQELAARVQTLETR